MCPLIYSGIFINCCHFLRRTKVYIVCRHGMIRLAYGLIVQKSLSQKKTILKRKQPVVVVVYIYNLALSKFESKQTNAL